MARRLTHTTYDGRDLPWQVTTGSTAQGTARTTVTEFDPNGNLRRTVKPRGVGGDELPEHGDNADQEGGPAGSAGRYATVDVYDADNLRTDQWMPWGDRDEEDRVRYRRSFTHDDLGRVTVMTSPYANATANSPAKPLQARTRYTHYDTGWIYEAIDEHYDSSTPVVDQTHRYTYDRRGDQTAWLNVGSTRRMTRSYYPSGALRLRSAWKSENDPTPRHYSYGYDAEGALAAMASWKRVEPDWVVDRLTSVHVDDLGRTTMVDETWSGGKDTKQVWDPNGNLVERRTDGEYLSGQTPDYRYGKTSNYTFDPVDRETRQEVWQDGRSGFRVTTTTYWPSGDMKSRTKTNGTVEDWGYFDDGQVARMRRQEPGATTFAKDVGYQYDGDGNRTLDERGAHAFNARDQLVHWVGGVDLDIEYKVDGSGAIVEEAVSGGETTEYRMVGDRLMSEWVDGDLDKTYHYDDLGNVTEIEPHQSASELAQFEFDEFGRMTSGTSFDAVDEVFKTERWAYDGLDRRDWKCLGGTAVDCSDGQKRDHTYVGTSELLSMHRLDGDDEENRKTASYDYTSVGERLGQDRMVTANPADGIFRPYATDANGTVEGLENQNGKVDGTGEDGTASYETNPYGKELNSSTLGEAARSNPFRFQGFYYDAGLKTYDMQARVYRPESGRFLSGDRFESAVGDFNLQSDPLTQNRYAFAGGNPVNRIEWDGHGADWCKQHPGDCEAARQAKARRALIEAGHIPPSGPMTANEVDEFLRNYQREHGSLGVRRYMLIAGRLEQGKTIVMKPEWMSEPSWLRRVDQVMTALSFIPPVRAARGAKALGMLALSTADDAVVRAAAGRLRSIDRLSRGTAHGKVRNFQVPDPAAAAQRMARSLTRGPGVRVVEHKGGAVKVYYLPEGGQVVVRNAKGGSRSKLWAVDVHGVPGAPNVRTHFK